MFATQVGIFRRQELMEAELLVFASFGEAKANHVDIEKNTFREDTGNNPSFIVIDIGRM